MTPRTRIGDERADLLAVGALAALGAAFLFEMVAMEAVPVARDIQLFFIPHKHILWEALQELEIPLWTPLVRTGYPVLANFQSGVFYPLHWLYAALPFFTAFNLLIAVHLLLGGVGMYVLCRRLDFGPVPAWMGAVSYMLGGYFVSLTNLVNALQMAAWAPAMVAVLVHQVRSWRPAVLAGMVGVYLMGFLAGEPQTFVLASGIAFCFGLVRAREVPGDWKRVVGAMGVTAAAVAGIAAVQILPTMEMVSQAARGAGLTLEQSGRYSLAPARLVHLLVANDFSDPVYRFGRNMQVTGQEPWLFSVYLGLGALVLAWHARWDRRRRREVLFWAALGAAGVILALGRHVPLFPWMHAHVPGFSAFRFPEKFFLLTGFAVPMLAAHGTEGLLDRPRPDWLDASAALTVLTAGLAVLAGWVLAPDRVHAFLRGLSPDAPMLEHFPFAYVRWGENLEVALAVLAATVALAGLHRKGHLRHSLFVGLLCVVVPLDFWLAHRGMIPVVDRSFYTREPAVHRALPLEEVQRTYRYRAMPFDEHLGSFYTFPGLPTEAAKWMWQQTMQPATGVLWDVQAHDAEDAIHLKAVTDTDELLRELPPDRRQRLLRIGSVKYVYYPLAAPILQGSTITRVDSVPGFLYELEDAIPRAYLAHGRLFGNETDALNAALAADARPSREVMVLSPGTKPESGSEAEAREPSPGDVPGTGEEEAEDDVPMPEGGDERVPEAAGAALPDPGSARIVSDEGEEIRIRVDPDTASYLVLTDTWYPGWKARVDGERRPLRRANYFFKAVPVRPGDRTVVFRYRSEPFRRGAWISGVTLLLTLVGLGGWYLRRGPDDPGGGPPTPGKGSPAEPAGRSYSGTGRGDPAGGRR